MRRFVAAAIFMGLAVPAAADTLSDAVAADTPYLVALYKHLHANPEVSFQEVETSARMAAELKKAGFTVTTGVGKTGVVAMLKNGDGPVVMLRADMDALPVTEETGLPYASKKTIQLEGGGSSGVMHACGHDIHMSSMIGTARHLAATKGEWAGTLIVIMQPAEERGGGARDMLADGLYERFPKPAHVIGLHDSATLPTGTLGISDGFVMANVDSVDIEVKGKGGHGAYPHTTKDPVVLASRIVGTLQTLISRELDPQTPAVVTVGAFNAGTKHNIISDAAHLQLTVRSYSDETRQFLIDGIKRIVRGEAIAAGMPEDLMPVVIVADEFTPATYNTPAQTMTIKAAFTERFGEDKVKPYRPEMGGEDFSRYHRADKSIESTLFRIGAVKQSTYDAAGGDPTKLPSLHSSKFAPDPEPTIRTGVEAMVTAARSVLGKR
ncbi:M20 metallopeptidase family protein [Sphingosinicella soli]|uniref:Hippurate hydrolase n=1 Tax=Sphingosinicella soli TaxID=333708 RepID=A0A7W7B3F9_9SPHN|nr:amidohydrolase [Sphingosinicella soli]MBB4633325.1 hippurate hydrolase [Sphingosinicella soli]